MDEESMPQAQPRATSWWHEGLRGAFFLKPRWSGLQVSLGRLLALLAAVVVIQVLVQRLYLTGSARFYWPALLSGWFTTVVAIALCWWLAPSGDRSGDPVKTPSAAALYTMHVAQWLAATVVVAAIMVPAARLGGFTTALTPGWTQWLLWTLPLLWFIAMCGVLFWRSGHGSGATRTTAIAVMAVATALASWSQPVQLWYPDPSEDAGAGAAETARFEWTPALLEAQMRTLPRLTAEIVPQRPGVIDLYAITFAPYSEEDVFLRESRMVAGVMAERFDARGRSLMLVNHRSTAAEAPWATPANLERAIAAMAARMDREEDVLFLHLASHGARSGELSAAMWPIKVDSLTPALLKAALDAAGVRHRVISISACYAGSWVAPLADEHTLVMTAADAEHTSYGCGRKSELTYFGRAVYDEALRKTWSFESALAGARGVIEQREKEAGKDDGFSNPQIHVGAAIRERLRMLEQQRAAQAK
jgi:Peptidase C13 family